MLFSKLLSLVASSLLVSAISIPQKDVKPTAFILTDISNEPDDAESLVRALLYSNEIDIKGIVATTSFWLNDTVHDEDIYPILDAYDKVQPNLLKHSPDYPSADYFRSIVSTGHPVYGLQALEEEKLSQGATNLIKAVDNTASDETIWVLVWGGAGVLAESLNEIRKTRDEKAVADFVSKVKVYAISDQDDAGSWIRHEFPRLFYIASLHGFNQYALSSWVGISGEAYNRFDVGGPASEFVTKEWLASNIRSIGALGEAYPEFMCIMEGDTPSLLHILPNGLNDPEHPKNGGWGGRYDLVDWSGRFNYYAGVTDDVIGEDGKNHCSDKATIWRWRKDFQNDFAGRMKWTVEGFKDSNHAPIVVVNDTQSFKPLELKTVAGSEVILDASKSYDLDKGDKLFFKWYHYRDVSTTQSNIIEVPEIEIVPLNKEGSIVSLTAPDSDQACLALFGHFRGAENCKDYHIILEVTDNGAPLLKSYRRIVLDISPPEGYKGKADISDTFPAADLQHDEL